MKKTGRVKVSEELYLQALGGVEAVFGRSSRRYQRLVKALDIVRSSD